MGEGGAGGEGEEAVDFRDGGGVFGFHEDGAEAADGLGRGDAFRGGARPGGWREEFYGKGSEGEMEVEAGGLGKDGLGEG